MARDLLFKRAKEVAMPIPEKKAEEKKEQETKKEKKSEDFCQAFYERGLLFRSMRHWKLFAHVAGNKMHERRMKERITI